MVEIAMGTAAGKWPYYFFLSSFFPSPLLCSYIFLPGSRGRILVRQGHSCIKRLLMKPSYSGVMSAIGCNNMTLKKTWI